MLHARRAETGLTDREAATDLPEHGIVAQLDLVEHRLDRLYLAHASDTTVVKIGRQAISWGNGLIYNPVDFWPIARRALGVISPRAIVLVEAEVWPNLVSIARRRGLEVSLVNARLSPRSERRYRKCKATTPLPPLQSNQPHHRHLKATVPPLPPKQLNCHQHSKNRS